MLAMTFRIIWGHTFLISLVNLKRMRRGDILQQRRSDNHLETFAQTEISFTSKMFEIRWRRTAIVERSIHQHFIISDAYEH
jgi:hypothetical protein